MIVIGVGRRCHRLHLQDEACLHRTPLCRRRSLRAVRQPKVQVGSPSRASTIAAPGARPTSVGFGGHSRRLAQAAALLHQRDIENLGKGDEKCEAARSDPHERGLPPTTRGVGEDCEDAEGKTEERRRRASDHAERGGHGKESPCTDNNRQDRAQPRGRAVTRAHANRLPETRKWNRRLGEHPATLAQVSALRPGCGGAWTPGARMEASGRG
jgi:hypothetical protein